MNFFVPRLWEPCGSGTDGDSGPGCGCAVGLIPRGSCGAEGNGDDILHEGQSNIHRNCPKYKVQRELAMN